MSRDIKFRVWDNVNYMSQPFTLKDLQEGKIKYTEDSVVMQFTGIRDKNGIDIYEGDWCLLHVMFGGTQWNDGDDAFNHIHEGVVKYRPSLGFYIKVHKTFDVDNQEYILGPKFKQIVASRTERIGNVYANKELLS